MSASHGPREAAVLSMVLPSLEAEGYEVFLKPPRRLLPPFMKGYQPDAIALRPDRKIAIEVKTGWNGSTKQAEAQDLHALFDGHPDWEFRLVYAPPLSRVPDIATEPKRVIEANLSRLPAIYDQSGALPALLSAWSVFEASARLLTPDLGRAQPPSWLLERLASDGSITMDEAARLRRLVRVRNEAAHGRLEVAFSRDDLLGMMEIVQTLLGLPEAPNITTA